MPETFARTEQMKDLAVTAKELIPKKQTDGRDVQVKWNVFYRAVCR
jgi:hypothetical protein